MKPGMEQASSTDRPNLAIPLGLLGGAGSYAVMTMLFGSHDAPAHLEVVGVALPTAVSVCIGLDQSHRVARGRPAGWAGFLASLFFGGTLAGGLLGAGFGLTEGGVGLALAGGIFGFFVTLLFVPLLAAAFVAWRRIGAARALSIAAASLRQRLWSATALGLAGCAFGMMSLPVLDPPAAAKWMGVYVVLTAIAMAAWGVAGEVQRSLWVGRIKQGLMPDRGHLADENTTLDLGVGEAMWSSDAPKPHPYRATPLPVCTVRGSPSLVTKAVRTSLLIHAIALGGSLLVASTIRGVLPERATEPETTPAVVEAAVPPASSCRHASWYNGRPPIVVDVNGDGFEDIVGLRWDSSKDDHSLTVAAVDGRSMSELWCDDSIASQWGSSHTRLVRSGQTLYLSDSEGLLHVYSLATGKEKVPALGVPSLLEALAGEDDTLWYRSGGSYKEGVVVHPDGRAVPGPRPSNPAVAQAAMQSCLGTDEAPPGQWVSVPRDDALGNTVYLQEAPAFPSSDTEQRELAGLNRESCKLKWRRPLALDVGPLHLHPQFDVVAHADRIFASHQLRDGSWRIGALDGNTGSLLWLREPTRTDRGSSFHALTATASRLYVMIEWRLDVFDAATGEPVGSIP